jgi:hypothetical protein
VCVTPRPWNGRDGDDGRDVDGYVYPQMYVARPMVDAAESRHMGEHMGYFPLWRS